MTTTSTPQLHVQPASGRIGAHAEVPDANAITVFDRQAGHEVDHWHADVAERRVVHRVAIAGRSLDAAG